MQTRILLVNFTQNETNKLKFPSNVKVHRGYLSDVLESPNKNFEEMFRAYFPLAIYEYKAIFVKLTTVPDLEEEFADKAETYHEKFIQDFIGYTLDGRGFLVVLLGDYKSKVLFHLGIRGITLHKVRGRDKTVSNLSDEFNKVFGKLESEVTMPTHRYITVDQEEDDFYKKFSGNFLIKNIYKNRAGDTLGCYHSNSMYSSDCSPAFFLLPLFRDSNVLIAQLLKELAVLNPKFLPEFYEPDWQNSDKYMPREIREYGDEIEKVIKKAKSLTEGVEEKQKAAREKYQYLTNLLTQKHDVLKNSVMRVFEEVFYLPVIDADADKNTTVAHEDIIVEMNGEQVLVEVKGDSSSYPGTGHIVQCGDI